MQKYKIQINGQEKTLGLKQKIFTGQHEVFLDQIQLGQFKNTKEAKQGKDFKLDEYNSVNIKFNTSGFHYEVMVTFNGHLLEESSAHPKYRKKSAFYLMLFLMGINFIIGFLGAYNTISAVSEAGYGAYNIIIGILYLLAIGMFKRSDPFLGIFLTIIVYSLDTAVVVLQMASKPELAGAMVTRILFFTILFKGLISSWPSFKEIFVKN